MRPSRRFRTLVDLFSRRFFENDLLAPDIDLRPAALWLVGALMAPSLLWTAKRVVPFGLMAVLGRDVMEAASWFDKLLLLTLAMVNAGVVTLLTWEALLIDRRDALVLGSLPLKPSTVVAAKALALARLFAAVAMLNVPAAFVLAFEVYAHWDFGLVARAFVVHALVAALASLSVASLLTAMLVGVSTIARGAALRVATVGIQAVVLGALTSLLVGLQWSPAVISAARDGQAGVAGWLAFWPPLWFLGLSQGLIGVELGRTTLTVEAPKALMMWAAALAALPMTLLLWRHALSSLVSASQDEAAGSRRAIGQRLAARLTRHPGDRALVQFFLAVLARSPRHRLGLVTAVGLAVTLAFEAVLLLSGRPPASPRWLTEFAAPVVVALTLSATARWLVTLPAELPASWTLALSAPFAGASVWRALHRVLLLVVVLPSTLLAAGLSAWQAGARGAVAHGGLALLMALALVERNLSRLPFLPFATEYVPGRANLSARWPFHLATLLFAVPAIAQLERWLVTGQTRRWLVALAIGGAGVLAMVVRRRRRQAELTTEIDTGAAWTPVTLNIGQTLTPLPRALQ